MVRRASCGPTPHVLNGIGKAAAIRTSLSAEAVEICRNQLIDHL
jgi:hypothetical protein